MSLLGKLARFTGVFGHYQKFFFQYQTMPAVLDGQVSLNECKFLIELVQRISVPGPIIEIGTLFGRSALIIAIAKEAERPFLTVDTYAWNPAGLSPDQHEHLTRRALQEAQAEHCLTVVTADKSEFYETYTGPPPAMVFIDADHSYEAAREDILWAREQNCPTISGDDYTPSMPGVVKAVDEAGGPRKLVEGMWVL